MGFNLGFNDLNMHIALHTKRNHEKSFYMRAEPST